MRSLREVQRAFSAAALFGDTVALADLGIVAGAPGPAARIAVYRNNVLGNYRHTARSLQTRRPEREQRG